MERQEAVLQYILKDEKNWSASIALVIPAAMWALLPDKLKDLYEPNNLIS